MNLPGRSLSCLVCPGPLTTNHDEDGPLSIGGVRPPVGTVSERSLHPGRVDHLFALDSAKGELLCVGLATHRVVVLAGGLRGPTELLWRRGRLYWLEEGWQTGGWQHDGRICTMDRSGVRCISLPQRYPIAKFDSERTRFDFIRC